jgi:LuxR family maltose regulon positive regulatory protein
LQQLPADAFVVRCVVALNLALLYWEQGQIEAALEAAVQAFEAAEKSGENVYVAISALSLQGNILGLRGQLDLAADLCRQAIELGERAGQLYPIPATSMGHWGLALVHYERFELDAATAHLEKALELSQQVGNSEATAGLYLSFARVALLAGNLAQAEDWLERAAERLRVCPSPHQHMGWLTLRGELYLASGDAAGAAQCVADCDWRPENLLAGPCQEFLSELVLLPRVLLAQGQPEAALEALAQLAVAAEANQHYAVLLDASVLQTLAQQQMGNDEPALTRLSDALALAAPPGYVRPFVAAGLPLIDLLRRAAAQGVEPLYVRRLLEALGEPEPQPLVEPLSERELQVLRLVSAGLSNREIAQELFVAVSTVKTHINHIYSKLDVKSRTQAVARASELGLV